MKKSLASLLALSLVIGAFPPCLADSAGNKTRVIVSMGDSYSSGEGIEPFYGQDEPMEIRCKNQDWLAHRSEKSWPGMLTLPGTDGAMKDHRGENWFFVAATRSRCSHLFWLTEEETGRGETAELKTSYNRDGVSGTGVISPQMDIFDELDARGLKADYVTVTIGGNDMGFDLLITSATLNLFDLLKYDTVEEKAEMLWKAFFVSTGVREKVKRVYQDIAARAGSQACIIVAGYPFIVGTGGSEVSFYSEDTVRIISLMTGRLNRELENLVEECRGEGINICFVSVEEAFEGHGAYSEDPWINPIIFGAKDQELKSFRIASLYSMHPNEKGACAYAECVQKEIDRLEAGRND